MKIWKFRAGILEEAPSLLEALGIREKAGARGIPDPGAAPGSGGARDPGSAESRFGAPVISAVGGGGKTTTLHALADEFVRAGQPVIVTTTTHIVEEPEPYFLRAEEDPERFLEGVSERLRRFGQVWAGGVGADGKFRSLSGRQMEMLWNFRIPVLIEADGAKRMPLKAPAPYEPVIHPRTTHVLAVYGLDAVGRPLEEVCFRIREAERLLGKTRGETVLPGDLARIAASPEGGRKGCPENAVYTVLLNKADGERELRAARETGKLLAREGIGRVVISTHACSGFFRERNAAGSRGM